MFWGVILLGIVAALFLLLNLFTPEIASRYLNFKTGFKTQIEEFSIGPFSQRIDLENFEVRNPTNTFPDADFLKVEQFILKTHPSNLNPRKTIIIDEMIIDVELLAYVQNTQGQVNFDAFIAPFHKQQSTTEETEETEETKRSSFLIRRLVVRIDTIKKVDYASGSLQVQNFNVGIDREYQDVQNLSVVFQPLIRDLEPLGASFVMDSLARALMDPETYQRLSTSGGESVGEQSSGGFNEVTELIKAVLESLKKE